VKGPGAFQGLLLFICGARSSDCSIVAVLEEPTFFQNRAPYYHRSPTLVLSQRPKNLASTPRGITAMALLRICF
jgi:hypothetical protein